MTGMISNARRLSIHSIPIARYDQWRRDRLAEAHSVVVDVAHHPDTLIILAARVVCAHTDASAELTEAKDLWRLLDRRSMQTVTAVALPTGGAT